MSDRVRVAAAEELPPGERLLTTANGVSLGVFNVDGAYYAIQNECAHQHGPVCEGKIQRELLGEITEPGEFDEERFGDRPTIACPWHGWEYDLATGDHLGDADAAVATYEVEVSDGDLFVRFD